MLEAIERRNTRSQQLKPNLNCVCKENNEFLDFSNEDCIRGHDFC